MDPSIGKALFKTILSAEDVQEDEEEDKIEIDPIETPEEIMAKCLENLSSSTAQVLLKALKLLKLKYLARNGGSTS